MTRKHKPKGLHSVIKFHILVRLALKNLMSKKLRTSLTIIGIAIGVGAVVFLVSLAFGLHDVVNQQVIGSKSVNAIDVNTPNSNAIMLNDKMINKIKQFAHVSEIAPAYILPGQISFQGSLADTVVYGTDSEYISLNGFKFISGSHQLNASNSAIVNTSLLSLIGQSKAANAINKQLTILSTVTLANGKQKTLKLNLVITGVINTGSGAEVYTSSDAFNAAGVAQYGQIKVLADNRSDVAALRQQISGLGLTTASPLDTLSQINNIFTIFTFVVIGFGGIGMVIAILGMFNTLTISLLERTKEIGLMNILGARNADIKRLLIFEALLLSLLGGIAGIVTAWFLGFCIDIFLTHFANDRGVSGSIHAFSVTYFLILETLLFILVVGLLVAFYPSKRAGKINPIDALRHE